jgi:hypothetical protein
MKLSFVHLSAFRSDCERLGLGDDAISQLEWLIMDRPDAGKMIPGTGGLRKIRFSPREWRRGKSGAVRVCYAYFIRADQVWFVAAYGKNEQENISGSDKAAYRKLLAQIEKTL